METHAKTRKPTKHVGRARRAKPGNPRIGFTCDAANNRSSQSAGHLERAHTARRLRLLSLKLTPRTVLPFLLRATRIPGSEPPERALDFATHIASRDRRCAYRSRLAANGRRSSSIGVQHRAAYSGNGPSVLVSSRLSEPSHLPDDVVVGSRPDVVWPAGEIFGSVLACGHACRLGGHAPNRRIRGAGLPSRSHKRSSSCSTNFGVVFVVDTTIDLAVVVIGAATRIFVVVGARIDSSPRRFVRHSWRGGWTKWKRRSDDDCEVCEFGYSRTAGERSSVLQQRKRCQRRTATPGGFPRKSNRKRSEDR